MEFTALDPLPGRWQIRMSGHKLPSARLSAHAGALKVCFALLPFAGFLRNVY